MSLHLLALETSGSVCSVALISRREDGLVSIARSEHDGTGEHAERMLPRGDGLLADKGLGRNSLAAVAFGQGPGGFTGLRVACGVAQGMAFALEIPVVPVASLMAVAQRDFAAAPNGSSSALRVVVQDARMNEVYLAAYAPEQNETWHTLQAPMLLAANDLTLWLEQAMRDAPGGLSADRPIRLVGDGLHLCTELNEWLNLQSAQIEIGPALRPDAASVGQLALPMLTAGQHVRPELAAPLYVRDKVAFTNREREQGMGGNPKAPGLGVALRPMTQDDVEAVARIRSFRSGVPWTAGNFSDGLKAGYGGWVAHRHGQVVGFSMTLFAPDLAHLLVIAVTPDAHGEGIETALVRHCERSASAWAAGRAT